MRVAALYDIHGNLPALEAVLAEARGSAVDLVIVGGDVVPGPMPREALALLMGLDLPVRFIYGNGELAVLAQRAAGDSEPSYWGTTSGRPLPKAQQEVVRWTGRQLGADDERTLLTWPGSITIEHPTLGPVLFCHGTPWSETDGFTRWTAEEHLLPVFRDVAEKLVICGHTHMQLDRMIGATRVVNAGSVGMPFGLPGADWLLLTDDVELRHTRYDFEAAAARVRATAYPQAEQFAAGNIAHPPSEEEMARAFAEVSFGSSGTSQAPNKLLPPSAAEAIRRREGSNAQR